MRLGDLRLLFTRAINTLRVRLDLIQRKPGRLELLSCKERRLIEIMRGSFIAAFAERNDRSCAHLRTEFDDGNVVVPEETVAAFLSRDGPRIKGKDDPELPAGSGDRQTRLGIAEWRLACGIGSLQTVALSPGDAPRSPLFFERRENVLQCFQAVARFDRLRISGKEVRLGTPAITAI